MHSISKPSLKNHENEKWKSKSLPQREMCQLAKIIWKEKDLLKIHKVHFSTILPSETHRKEASHGHREYPLGNVPKTPLILTFSLQSCTSLFLISRFEQIHLQRYLRWRKGTFPCPTWHFLWTILHIFPHFKIYRHRVPILHLIQKFRNNGLHEQ